MVSFSVWLEWGEICRYDVIVEMKDSHNKTFLITHIGLDRYSYQNYEILDIVCHISASKQIFLKL